MTWFIAAIGFALTIGSLIMAVVGASVWISVLKRGTRAADEAYRRGDTLSTYFDPSKTRPVSGPRHDARAAIGGRRHRQFGVVAVSEHASDNA